MAVGNGSEVTIVIGTEATLGGGNTDGIKMKLLDFDSTESQTETEINEIDGTAIAGKTALGVVSVEWTARARLRPVQMGFWETLQKGAPGTTGTGPYTSTWTCSTATIDSFALELLHTDITIAQQFFGMTIRDITYNVVKEGMVEASITGIGLKVVGATTTMFTGSVTTTYFGEGDEFEPDEASITLGTSTGSFLDGTMTFARQNVNYINRVDGTKYGFAIERGKFKGAGSLTQWFENKEIMDAARSETAESLAYAYDDSTNSITCSFPSTKWKRHTYPVDPNVGSIQTTVPFEGTETAMTTVIVSGNDGTVYGTF